MKPHKKTWITRLQSLDTNQLAPGNYGVPALHARIFNPLCGYFVSFPQAHTFIYRISSAKLVSRAACITQARHIKYNQTRTKLLI